MKKHGAVIIIMIFGFLIFVIASFAVKFNLRGVEFLTGELLINISATLISISVLAFVYGLLGGEPIISLIRYLIDLQGFAHKLKIAGIEEVVISRRNFEYDRIHKDIIESREMFIISRTFDSIKYSDVKSLIQDYLKKPNTLLKILIDRNTSNNELLNFHKGLPTNLKIRMKIQQSDSITCCMYGGDYRIYVTPYLHTRRGEESPSILCKNEGSKSLYSVYRSEFDEIWNNKSFSIH